MEPIKINEEEARKASKEYFGGDELAAQVWVNKYALKDSQGNLYERTPVDMLGVWLMKFHALRRNILIRLLHKNCSTCLIISVISYLKVVR